MFYHELLALGMRVRARTHQAASDCSQERVGLLRVDVVTGGNPHYSSAQLLWCFLSLHQLLCT